MACCACALSLSRGAWRSGETLTCQLTVQHAEEPPEPAETRDAEDELEPPASIWDWLVGPADFDETDDEDEDDHVTLVANEIEWITVQVHGHLLLSKGLVPGSGGTEPPMASSGTAMPDMSVFAKQRNAGECVLCTPPCLVAVDVHRRSSGSGAKGQLARTFVCRASLPTSLLPSFTGKTARVVYVVTLAVKPRGQRALMAHVPFRVVPSSGADLAAATAQWRKSFASPVPWCPPAVLRPSVECVELESPPPGHAAVSSPSSSTSSPAAAASPAAITFDGAWAEDQQPWPTLMWAASATDEHSQEPHLRRWRPCVPNTKARTFHLKHGRGDDTRVGHLMLLGQTSGRSVRGTFDFSQGGVPCIQLSVGLEFSERVTPPEQHRGEADVATPPGEAAAAARRRRRRTENTLVASWHQYVWSALQASFELDFPAHALPAMDLGLVALSWHLLVEFVILREDKEGRAEKMQWRVPLSTSIRHGVDGDGGTGGRDHGVPTAIENVVQPQPSSLGLASCLWDSTSPGKSRGVLLA